MGRTLQRYKKLFDQVKKDAPHRVYFLYGPEEFLKKEFIGELIKTRLSEQNRAFNLDIFHADEFDRDAFADRITSYPLFTDRRMVILKGFESLSTCESGFRPRAGRRAGRTGDTRRRNARAPSSTRHG